MLLNHLFSTLTDRSISGSLKKVTFDLKIKWADEERSYLSKQICPKILTNVLNNIEVIDQKQVVIKTINCELSYILWKKDKPLYL